MQRTRTSCMRLLAPLALICLSSASFALGEQWTKVLLHDAAATRGARCLDGSPGGYYIRPGSDPKRWIVFHQGGGWCGSDENCLLRAATQLGSSAQWPETYTDVYEASALWASAPFNQSTLVYAMYCDGGSWAGNTQRTVANKTVYFRGRALLDALIDDLLSRGLRTADELLYGGCSAGALTAYLHTDYVRSRVPSSVKMVSIADAMFSVVSNNIRGQPQFQRVVQYVLDGMNASASLNDGCVAAHREKNTTWKCLYGSEVVSYVQTPLFILNSKYDTWQEKAILGLDCQTIVSQCNTTEQKFFVAYGHKLTSLLDGVPARHGAFLTNCPAHCQTGTGGDWTQRSVGGTTLQDAVGTWYTAAIAAQDPKTYAAPRWISRCDIEPCATDKC